MKVNVKVTPRASKNEVVFLEEENFLKVKTTAAPVDGKANEEVVKLVAEYLGVNKRFVQISTGLASKNKIIDILDTDITKENLIKKPRLF
jgi:uncharacterized protein (TIGR00251 family)